MTNQKNAIIRAFSKAANNYDLHAKMQRIAANHLFNLARKDLTNSELILDSGSGTGYLHELLRKNKIYCPLIQADIAFAMSQKSSQYGSAPPYGNTYTITADIESLPICSNSIDLSFSNLTLQWTDIPLALSQLHRTLKPEGTLAISTIGKGSLCELIECFSALDELEHSNRFYDQNQLQLAINSAGFSDIKIETKTICENFTNLRTLMGSIKGVGASYKPNRKYLGKDYFIKLEEIYQAKFGNNLPLTWKIIYATAVKNKTT